MESKLRGRDGTVNLKIQGLTPGMALNAHNRMPGTGKRRNSLPKREMRAALDPAYLEQLLSLV